MVTELTQDLRKIWWQNLHRAYTWFTQTGLVVESWLKSPNYLFLIKMESESIALLVVIIIITIMLGVVLLLFMKRRNNKPYIVEDFLTQIKQNAKINFGLLKKCWTLLPVLSLPIILACYESLYFSLLYRLLWIPLFFILLFENTPPSYW